MRLSLLSGILLFTLPRAAAAQVPSAGVLSGFVVDSAGAPVESAEVALLSEQRAVITKRDGAFVFDKLANGRYTISVRATGFTPQTREVVVGPGSEPVRVALVRRPQVLSATVVSASRGGLSGVVADTANELLPNAQIIVMGSSHRTTTDSAGAFHLPLRPGKYFVRVRRPGYEARMIGVDLPKDSGQRVYVTMRRATSRAAEGSEGDDVEVSMRLARRGPATSAILTRQDIIRSGAQDLVQLASMGAVRRVDASCPVSVANERGLTPMWTLLAADIEMVEVYDTKRPMRGGARDTRRSDRIACPQVYVWLRK